jgi:hypothetical protein
LRDGNEVVEAVVAALELDQHEGALLNIGAVADDFSDAAVGKRPEGKAVDGKRRDAGGGQYFQKVATFHIFSDE